MSGALTNCREVKVATFRGDRSAQFDAKLRQALNDEKSGKGPGPSARWTASFTRATQVYRSTVG